MDYYCWLKLYLKEKMESEMNGIESILWQYVKNNNITYFPI